MSLLSTYSCQSFFLNKFGLIFFEILAILKLFQNIYEMKKTYFHYFFFAHKTVLSIISVKYFCNFFMLSFIWFFVFEFLIKNAHFFISFNFSTFIDFYILRNVFDVVTIFNKSFVNIEMWLNDWLIFDFVLQCSILLINLLNMNIKSIVFWEFLIFQMIILYESVNFMSALSIISINLFVITC